MYNHSMATAKAYLLYGSNIFGSYTSYRLNFFLELLGNSCLTFATLALWISAFDSTPYIRGFDKPTMITYVLLGGLISTFLLQTAQGDGVNNAIKDGTLAQWLTKPVSYPLFWLVNDFSRRVITFILGAVPFVVVGLFMSNIIVPPFSFINVCVMVVCILLSALLHYYIFTIIAITAFWAQQTWGPRFLVRVILEIGTGALVPLSFISGWIGAVLQFLPFKFFAQIPIQIYLGQLSQDTTVYLFVQLVLWLLLAITISHILYKRGLRFYGAVGG